MSETEQDNYFRLVILIVDICAEVLREYFEKTVLKGIHFEDYLNQYKHILYHAWKNIRCCACVKGKAIQNADKCLSKDQFTILYDILGTAQHKFSSKEGCLCRVSAKSGIKVTILDASLVHCILKHCTNVPTANEQWITTIIKYRSKIFHSTDTKCITNAKFKKIWYRVDCSVKSLTSSISPEYENIIKHKVHDLLTRDLLADVVLKERHLLEEYWRDKCLEQEKLHEANFERQNDHNRLVDSRFETIEANLHRLENAMNQKYTEVKEELQEIKSMRSNVKNVTVQFHADHSLTEVFNIGSHRDRVYSGSSSRLYEENEDFSDEKVVPISVQLETPLNWNRDMLVAAIRQLTATNYNDALRVRSSSPEDLRMLIDIVKNLVTDTVNLQSQLLNLLQEIFRRSNIDTNTQADVKLMIETLSERNTELLRLSQVVLPAHSVSVTRNVKARFIQKFNFPKELNKQMDFRGCVRLSNGINVFTDYTNKRILTDDKEFKLQDHPFDIAIVKHNVVIVSLPWSCRVDSIDLDTFTILNTYQLNEHCYGVSVYGQSLIVAVRNKGFIMLSLENSHDSRRIIEIDNSEDLYYVNAYNEKLFFFANNCIQCLKLDGSLIWRVKCEALLMPQGIAVDNEENCYVAGYISNNVVVCDGKSTSEIVQNCKDVSFPTGLFFERKTNELLLCNAMGGNGVLFDIYK